MTRLFLAVPLAIAFAIAAPILRTPVAQTGATDAHAQIRVPARPPRLSRWQVQRSGRAAGTGGVCAYYSGYERLGSPRNKNVFRRRACFPSRAQCRRWLYWAQSYYPQRELLKRCR